VILVDTSVWVDFFRDRDRAADLAEHLESNLVLLHPWVVGELVSGGLGPRRKSVIADLKRLPRLTAAARAVGGMPQATAPAMPMARSTSESSRPFWLSWRES
jgi:predicted nucleic acid-binding protein